MGTRQGTFEQVGGWGLFTLLADSLAGVWREPAPREQLAAGDVPAAMPSRSWLDRLDHWFWVQQQRDRERYLSQAQDIFDLEARIRDLERGSVRGFR